MSWIGVFDLFKIGVGPSSSHTVGPMIASLRFALELDSLNLLHLTSSLRVELFGSLALTGVGHATDSAVLMGLLGEHPETIDPALIIPRKQSIVVSKRLRILDRREIDFDPSTELIFHRDKFLPEHPNAMRFTAFDSSGQTLLFQQSYSVGGGFVVIEGKDNLVSPGSDSQAEIPFAYTSANDLLSHCKRTGLSISQIVQRNELVYCDEAEITKRLDKIWQVMEESIARGSEATGVLPGGLGVRRRANHLLKRLTASTPDQGILDPMRYMDWVTLFALAVNEENAAGGRVVTAPTNGAAGVVPAVMAYYQRFIAGSCREGLHDFLRTAAAIGSLYKRNASLSAAEMGCQGEVGVACSMAAGGLAAVMGGTPEQIENAAEIGMEHNLGLTCDPVGGLVQVPCIERNTMGAIKAINAARLAVLYGDGTHRVSLDRVIETMRQTGVDMQSKYKETSLGGLAVNVINC